MVNHSRFLLDLSIEDLRSDMLIMMDKLKKLEQQNINLNAKITTKKKKVKK